MDIESKTSLSTRAASGVLRAFLMTQNLLSKGLITVPVSGVDEVKTLLRIIGLGESINSEKDIADDELLSIEHSILSYDNLIAGNFDAAMPLVRANFPNLNDSIFRSDGKTAYLLDVKPRLDHFANQIWYTDTIRKLDGIIRGDITATSVAVIEDEKDGDHAIKLRIETPNATGRVYPKGDRTALEDYFKPMSDWLKQFAGVGFSFRIGQTTYLQADVPSGTAAGTAIQGSQFTLTFPIRSNYDGQGRVSFKGKGFLTVAHAFRHVLDSNDLSVFIPPKPVGQRLLAGVVKDYQFSFQSSPRRPDRVDAAFTSLDDNFGLGELADIKIRMIRRPVEADRRRQILILTSMRSFQTAEIYELNVVDAQFVDDDLFKPRYGGLFSLRSSAQNQKGLRVPLTLKGDSGSLVCASLGGGGYAAIGMIIAGGRRTAEERYPLSYALPLPEAFAALGLLSYISPTESRNGE